MHYLTNKKGFLMIDLLITVVILSVGLVAIVAAFSSMSRTTSHSKYNSLAAQFAHRQMAILKQGESSFSHTANFWTTKSPAIVAEIENFNTTITPDAKVTGLDYTLNILSDDVLPTEMKGRIDMIAVQMKVTWTENRQPQSVVITNYFRTDGS